MELVAFSGYARTGKDEAVKALEHIGWTRVAFADKVRDFLYVLNPIVREANGPQGSGTRLQHVIKRWGWNGYKNSPYGNEIRALLQRLGVECGRQTISENIWVDAAFSGLEDSGKYGISDCRFVNEADGVRARGGKVFRVTRPGVGPANSHLSETALDDYDFDGYIVNDGTLEEFRTNVYKAVMAYVPNSRLTLVN